MKTDTATETKNETEATERGPHKNIKTAAVGRSDLFRIKPEDIIVEEGFNVRVD